MVQLGERCCSAIILLVTSRVRVRRGRAVLFLDGRRRVHRHVASSIRRIILPGPAVSSGRVCVSNSWHHGVRHSQRRRNRWGPWLAVTWLSGKGCTIAECVRISSNICRMQGLTAAVLGGTAHNPQTRSSRMASWDQEHSYRGPGRRRLHTRRRGRLYQPRSAV